MNIQSLPKFAQPKILKSPEQRLESPAPETASKSGGNREFLEVFVGSTLTGLACGLSANTLGSGWGALASIPASGVAWSGIGYATARKDGYENLAGIAGGVAGLTFGLAGSVGAAVGSLAGHPVVGGVLGGAIAGAVLGKNS